MMKEVDEVEAVKELQVAKFFRGSIVLLSWFSQHLQPGDDEAFRFCRSLLPACCSR